MGEADVSRHVKSALHLRNREAKKSSAQLKQVCVSTMMCSSDELTQLEF